MHAEIDEKQRIIDLLKAELEKRQWEFDELQNVLRDALGEGKDLDLMIEDWDKTIAELEAILKDSKGGRLKDA
jgi:chaperonin cofactor prefoldin